MNGYVFKGGSYAIFFAIDYFTFKVSRETKYSSFRADPMLEGLSHQRKQEVRKGISFGKQEVRKGISFANKKLQKMSPLAHKNLQKDLLLQMRCYKIHLLQKRSYKSCLPSQR